MCKDQGVQESHHSPGEGVTIQTVQWEPQVSVGPGLPVN